MAEVSIVVSTSGLDDCNKKAINGAGEALKNFIGVVFKEAPKGSIPFLFDHLATSLASQAEAIIEAKKSALKAVGADNTELEDILKRSKALLEKLQKEIKDKEGK